MWFAGAAQGNTPGGGGIVGWNGGVGYGYGSIGPNGPDSGNWPFVPGQSWWSGAGGGGSILPAVTRATQLIVGPIVDTTWQVRRYDEDRRLRLPTWMWAPMLAGRLPGILQPLYPASQRRDSTSFWSTLLTHALWWGRGAFIYLEDADGQPQAGSLRILNPFMVGWDSGEWVLDPGGDEPLQADFDGGFTVGGRRWQMRVLRGLPPHDGDDAFGGVLIRHAEAFGIGAHIQTYASNVFHQGIPAGVLKVSQPNFGEDEAQNLRRAWQRAHGGDRRGVAILNSSVDFAPISLNPVETDLDKIKRLSLMDIAHAFGLSSAWLDTGSDSLTYANTNDRRRDLKTHSLDVFGGQLMELFTTVLPAGQRAEIRWSDYTAASFEERMPAMVQAIEAGVLTVAEVREQLGFPPVSEAQSGPERR